MQRLLLAQHFPTPLIIDEEVNGLVYKNTCFQCRLPFKCYIKLCLNKPNISSFFINIVNVCQCEVIYVESFKIMPMGHMIGEMNSRLQWFLFSEWMKCICCYAVREWQIVLQHETKWPTLRKMPRKQQNLYMSRIKTDKGLYMHWDSWCCTTALTIFGSWITVI